MSKKKKKKYNKTKKRTKDVVASHPQVVDKPRPEKKDKNRDSEKINLIYGLTLTSLSTILIIVFIVLFALM